MCALMGRALAALAPLLGLGFLALGVAFARFLRLGRMGLCDVLGDEHELGLGVFDEHELGLGVFVVLHQRMGGTVSGDGV